MLCFPDLPSTLIESLVNVVHTFHVPMFGISLGKITVDQLNSSIIAICSRQNTRMHFGMQSYTVCIRTETNGDWQALLLISQHYNYSIVIDIEWLNIGSSCTSLILLQIQKLPTFIQNAKVTQTQLLHSLLYLCAVFLAKLHQDLSTPDPRWPLSGRGRRGG